MISCFTAFHELKKLEFSQRLNQDLNQKLPEFEYNFFFVYYINADRKQRKFNTQKTLLKCSQNFGLFKITLMLTEDK